MLQDDVRNQAVCYLTGNNLGMPSVLVLLLLQQPPASSWCQLIEPEIKPVVGISSLEDVPILRSNRCLITYNVLIYSQLHNLLVVKKTKTLFGLST